MNKKISTVLMLNSKEAFNYFLDTKQYQGFELPAYFEFDKVLQFVRKKIGKKPYEKCLQHDIRPETLNDVNFDILLNKDGKYAVRPIIPEFKQTMQQCRIHC